MSKQLSRDEQEYIKDATSRGILTAEMAYIIMVHRTRTAPSTYYDKANHRVQDTQAEFTSIKIEINKILAGL